MNTSEAAENFLQSAAGAALARIAMICTMPAIGVITWFGSQWLDQRFEKVETAQHVIAKQVDDLGNSVDKNTEADKVTHDHLVIAEQSIATARDDRDRFQRDALAQLMKVQDNTQHLAENVSALNATLAQFQIQFQQLNNSRQNPFQLPGGAPRNRQ